MTLTRRLMELTGTEYCGNKIPPEPRTLYIVNDGRRITFHKGDRPDAGRDALIHVIAPNNDGFELWIGYPNEWLFHCSTREARRIARYVLLDWWALTEWFGLRRWIYYRALHSEVNRRRRYLRGGPPVTPAR